MLREKRSEAIARFHRVLLERTLGALADLAVRAPHARGVITGSGTRAAGFTSFLKALVRLLS